MLLLFCKSSTDKAPVQVKLICTVWVNDVNCSQSSVSPVGEETSPVYWIERVPVAENTMSTAGTWAESLSLGAGTTVGVGGGGVATGVPVPTISPDPVTMGSLFTSCACTNAALTQPLPSGPAVNSICSQAPFASLPVRLTTSCEFSVPMELKSVPGPL